jgi:putative transposase
MPWKTACPKDQRHRFILQLLRRQKPLAVLCREWSISRKTAYKWLTRFNQKGRSGLCDLAHLPTRVHGRPRAVWLARIRRSRSLHPSWGAPKLRWAIKQRFGAKNLPSEPAIGRWLKHWNLTKKRCRPRRKGPTRPRPKLTQARRAHDVWTVDFKGHFRIAGRRVEPLTVRDQASRMILAVTLQATTRIEETQGSFVRIFQTSGLPKVIRCDNGTPFGSSGALGLTRLSAWWVKLGIRVEFIEPGRPDQNGAHEQVHRVYKAETLQPPARTLRGQKQRTKAWIKAYNHQRPHEGIAMKVPAEKHRPNPRKAPVKQTAWSYPADMESRLVKGKGMIHLQAKMRYVGEAFEGERVGLKRNGQKTWEVYYGPHQIGELGAEENEGILAIRYREKGGRKSRQGAEPRQGCGSRTRLRPAGTQRARKASVQQNQ